jgi:hypothetical protein
MELFLGLQRRFHPYGSTQATSTVLTEIEDNQVVSELTLIVRLFRDRAGKYSGKWVSYTQPELVASTNGKSCLSSWGSHNFFYALTFSGFFCRRQDLLQRYFGWIRVYHDRVSGAGSTERRYFRTEHKHNLLFPLSSTINNDGRGKVLGSALSWQ